LNRVNGKFIDNEASLDKSGGMETETWKTQPISPTCEVWNDKRQPCDRPTTHAYRAMGSGWMALCFKHAQKHTEHGGAILTDQLITQGEKWK
jgi:hypothetical protein